MDIHNSVMDIRDFISIVHDKFNNGFHNLKIRIFMIELRISTIYLWISIIQLWRSVIFKIKVIDGNHVYP